MFESVAKDPGVDALERVARIFHILAILAAIAIALRAVQLIREPAAVHAIYLAQAAGSAVLAFITARGIEAKRPWAKTLGYVLGILALFSFPVGTVVGIAVLIYVRRASKGGLFTRPAPAAGLIALVVLTAAAPTMAIVPVAVPLPPSAQATINNGSGNQTDPHVGGDLAAYTADTSGGLTQIRYFNFSTFADNGINNAGAFDLLSDTNGGIIVFTRVGAGKQAIMAFDAVNGTGPVELDPVAGSRRRGAAIGGNTVAWIDLSTGSAGEIAVYDMTTSAPAQALTNNTLVDRRAAVSPDGGVIVWEQCASATANCDIVQAIKAGGGWTVSALTSTIDHESFPDTNGTIVVYGSNRAGSFGGPDIYWMPVGGGPEMQLELSGTEQNPNVSGDLIVFEHQDAWTSTFDLFAYDVTTNRLYQLTNTASLSETLNDVSVSPSGAVRVVWSVFEGSDENVYGLSFQLPRTVVPEVVTLSPASAVNRVGTAHTLMAEVTDRTGAPANGVTVIFQVTGTVNFTTQCITFIDGRCGLSYVNPQWPGTDLIIAFADLNGNGQLDHREAIGPCPYFPCDGGEPWAYATKTWVSAGVDAIDELISLVESLNLSPGITSSLRAKLNAARRAAAQGQVALACRLLDAFKQEVQAQSGKALTSAEAAQLLAAADDVKAALSCP